ncbi:hypothetical protein NXF25_015525 [Crotalus adamanteus]|uniref:Uncharacterized protein n=1 Tax=Crotalus adamanteus TaxID=8729 RepID=A0AAW1AVS2_CROAD
MRLRSWSCSFRRWLFPFSCYFSSMEGNQLNVEWRRAIQMDPNICCLHLNRFWMPIANSLVASFFPIAWKNLELFLSPFFWWSQKRRFVFFLSHSLSLFLSPHACWKNSSRTCVSGPKQPPPSPLPVLNYLVDGRCVVLSQPLQTKVSYCYLLSRSSSGVENLTSKIKEQISDEKICLSLSCMPLDLPES